MSEDTTKNSNAAETTTASVKAAAKANDTAAKSARSKAGARTVKAKRVSKRRAAKAPAKIAAAAKTNRRTANSARRINQAAATATAAQIERATDMTNDFTSMFAGFQLPGAERYQSLMGDAGTRSQEFAAKGQKAVEQFSDLAKSNLEAMVKAGRIAATGARSIGEDMVVSSRENLERASTNAKSLAAATSPTEFFQLQTELVRASFDRMVAQSSKMTEQVVKLAGEAIQPISTRASINAERINELMA